MVALTVLFVKQPLLTTISVVVLPACVVPIIIYRPRGPQSARAMQGHLAELSTLVHESFTGNRIIKAYNLEEAVSGQFRQITGKFIGHVMRVIRSNELPSQLTEFLAGIGVAMVLGYGVIFIMSKRDAGPITGDFVAFVMAFVLMYPSIKSLTRIHNQLLQAQAASQRVFELLAIRKPDSRSRPSQTAEGRGRGHPLRHGISFTATSRYCGTLNSPSKPDRSWRWSAPAVPAKPRSRICCCDFMIRKRARCASVG